jgi:Protein of unknown function (DUF1236)
VALTLRVRLNAGLFLLFNHTTIKPCQKAWHNHAQHRQTPGDYTLKTHGDEMNRTNLLVTSAVVAFVTATGASMAQQERVPQQERSAPAEKIAPQNTPAIHNQMPNSRVGEPQNRDRTSTTAQAPREDRQSQPSERSSEQERGKTEQPSRSERDEHNRATGQAPRNDRSNRATEQNGTTGQAPREDRTRRPAAQSKPEQEREKIERTEENPATTGQGAAGTRANINVNLTPEKRTQIHEVIVKERNGPQVSSPNFSVSVGTRVPRTVRFVALPQAIVELEPAWRGFEYFMVGDEIVVVDPGSLEIVAVIDA